MDVLPAQLSRLAESLRTLPGVGARTAMRMALHLTENRYKPRAHKLAEDLLQAVSSINHCHKCRHLAVGDLCSLCLSDQRDNLQLCVVETPTDLLAIESSGSYKGRYFVLHGKLSPIDGIGPNELGFDQLEQLVIDAQQASSSTREHPPVTMEIILALGTTVEANVTCGYLQKRLAPFEVRITRLAQGIPAGGNVDLLDSITLGKALQQRVHLDQA